MKLFSLIDAYPSPKLIGLCKCLEGDTYGKLIPLLENTHIVGRPFQFFDIECRCIINCNLEEVNKVFLGFMCFASS